MLATVTREEIAVLPGLRLTGGMATPKRGPGLIGSGRLS